MCIFAMFIERKHSSIKLADDCFDGEMRLVGGETEAEGRLELCHGYRWGTVCDNQWTDEHTALVCRHLGFSDVIGGRYIYTKYVSSRCIKVLHNFRLCSLYIREVW